MDELTLRPGTLLLLAVTGVVIGGILIANNYRSGTDGVFVFAAACLLGAVLRAGQTRRE